MPSEFSSDRNPPFAMICWGSDECVVRAVPSYVGPGTAGLESEAGIARTERLRQKQSYNQGAIRFGPLLEGGTPALANELVDLASLANRRLAAALSAPSIGLRPGSETRTR
jgi:hypothetical protein